MTGGVPMKTMKTRRRITIATCFLLGIFLIVFWLFQLFQGNYASIFWLIYSASLLAECIYMVVKKDSFERRILPAKAENAYYNHCKKLSATLPYEAFVILVMLALFVVAAIIPLFL